VTNSANLFPTLVAMKAGQKKKQSPALEIISWNRKCVGGRQSLFPRREIVVMKQGMGKEK